MGKKWFSEAAAKACIYALSTLAVFGFLAFWHSARVYGAAAPPLAAPAEHTGQPAAAPAPFSQAVAPPLPQSTGVPPLQDDTPDPSSFPEKPDWEDAAENMPSQEALAAELERIRGMGYDLPNVLELEFMGDYHTTSYCCEVYPHICGGNGVTASGTAPTPGLTCAADWSYLPRFTWLYIEGVGIRRVEDTGSAIKQQRLDIAVDTHDNALRWRGFGKHRVWVLAWGANKR